MAAPYKWPNPNCVTPKDPYAIAESDQIIGLYNQANPDDKMAKVTQKVLSWFVDGAKAHGWTDGNPIHSACVLYNEPVDKCKVEFDEGE